MDKKSSGLQSNRLISTDLIKAIAIILIIINHTINVKFIDKSIIKRQYYLLLWVGQAVSFFIVVTGVHYSKSMENLITSNYVENDSWVTGVVDWYKKDYFIKKIGRLWIPYTIEQIIWFISYKCMGKSVNNSFFYYISGGVGPGGYYTVCMIQIIVIFPLLYYVIKKYNIMGVLSIIVFNVLYEFMVRYGWIRDSFNRLCSVRLFTGIALGIVIYLYYQKIKGTVIPWIWFVFGFVLLLWNTRGGYSFQIASESWASSSFAVVPYSAAFVYLMVAQEDKIVLIKKKNFFISKILDMILYVSKASYHIFLVQQLYFCFRIYERNEICLLEAAVIDIVICVVTGCLFYYLYTKCELLCHRRGKIYQSIINCGSKGK